MSESAIRLNEQLHKRSLTIATGESCTGGGLAARLTEIPGASAVFLGSIVAYRNRVKTSLLGVSETILEDHGAVSPETAAAMAVGAQERFASDIGVGITGVAGPGGGSVEKPVGLVYIAVADQNGVVAERFHFEGDRIAVRLQAVDAAIDLVLERLSGP